MPATQQTVLSLSRDVEVNTRIYRDLIDTIQQLRIAKAGTVGNVQIIDEALPPQASFTPNKTRILAGSTGIGLAIGLGLTFLLVKLRSRVESPEEIERHLGLTVYATIPHSQVQQKFTVGRRKQTKKTGSFVLTIDMAADPVVESFRSLRTSLHFMLMESKSNILLITGPQPGVGKSFVSLNLAAVLAQGQKKVLLIDADMRRGHLDQFLGHERAPGLSELISGQAKLEDVIRQTRMEHLSFIPTGRRPPLELTVKRLAQSGANVRGFILNDVQPHHGYGYRYRYGYRYGYGYGYKAYRADQSETRDA